LSQPIYRKLFGNLLEKYPIAKRLEKQGAFIGMHQGLADEDMFFIADTIKEHLKK